MKRITLETKILINIFKTQIQIPEYQRSYSWKKELAENLLTSIIEEFNELSFIDSENEFSSNLSQYMVQKDESIYLGQIVRQDEQIVDGQQRLTTLMIIMKAIFDWYFELSRGVHVFSPSTFENMGEPRIISAKKDTIASKIIQSSEPISKFATENKEQHKTWKKTVFGQNYYVVLKGLQEEFSKKNSRQSLTRLKNLYTFITNFIYVTQVTLKDVEDAVSFFEVMNSKSQPLTPADLIKNFMIKSSSNAIAAAESWNKIEDELSDNIQDLSKFIRYVYLCQTGDVTAKNLFAKIKESKSSVTEELGKYLESYKKILGLVQNDSSVIDAQINFILTLGAKESLTPVILEILNTYKKADNQNNVLIAEKLFDELVAFSYKYFFRSGFKANNYSPYIKEICDNIRAKKQNPLSKLNQIYEEQCIERGVDSDFEYSSSMFEFKTEDSTDAIKMAKGILPLLYAKSVYENARNKDSKEITILNLEINFENLDIEHIYPKTPSENSEWTNLQAQDDIWKIGNLIPISNKKNRTSKNADFKLKFEYYCGKKHADGSEIQDNDDIKPSDFFRVLFTNVYSEITPDSMWGSQEINERTERIAKLVEKYNLFKI